MVNNKKISVIIPCKNEEGIIKGTIRSVPSYVDEIIVVDNGSTDNTAQVAREAGAVVLVENRKIDGIGYGFAHITGINQATGDYIFGMDGDDTYDVERISEIVMHMEEQDLDFVSCNRLPLKNSRAISPLRRLGIYILNIEILFLYGKYIKDSLSGMWGMKRDIVPLLDLKMGDWNLSPEIKISAMNNKGIGFAEYHTNHFVREKEPSKQQIWKTGWGHFRYIFIRRITVDNPIYGWLRRVFEGISLGGRAAEKRA